MRLVHTTGSSTRTGTVPRTAPARERTPAPHAILDAMADAVFVADVHQRLAYLNRAAQRVTGWSRADAIGRPVAEFIVGEHDGEPAGGRCCRIVTRTGTHRPAEASYAPLGDSAAAAQGRIIVCRDIGPALALSAALSHRAEHDALTGLPNRNRLLSRLSAAVTDRTATATPRAIAVGFLDIDGMKRVNDTLGHAAGDELLVAVARRLSAAVRGSDTVARLGGDEFVVVLNRMGAATEAEAVVRALHGTLTAPYHVGGVRVRIGVSAGLAFCPEHGLTPTQLLAQADRAMYGAKQARTGVALAQRRAGV